MRPYLARQAATGRSGVAAIGVAQEFAPVFTATKKGGGKAVRFSFTKADRRVTCYYFYLWLRHEVARCEWLREGGRLMPET